MNTTSRPDPAVAHQRAGHTPTTKLQWADQDGTTYIPTTHPDGHITWHITHSGHQMTTHRHPKTQDELDAIISQLTTQAAHTAHQLTTITHTLTSARIGYPALFTADGGTLVTATINDHTVLLHGHRDALTHIRDLTTPTDGPTHETRYMTAAPTGAAAPMAEHIWAAALWERLTSGTTTYTPTTRTIHTEKTRIKIVATPHDTPHIAVNNGDPTDLTCWIPYRHPTSSELATLTTRINQTR